MKNAILKLAIFVLLSPGFCHGAGVITTDFLRGATGESVTFTTSVKPAAEAFLALTWSVNGTINVITSTNVDVVGEGYEGRVAVDKATGSLVLTNVTEKDSGEYELLIIPHGGPQIQGTAKLQVQTKVSNAAIICPTENLREGQTLVNLTCDADGFVSSRLWVKDGKPLMAGGRFSFHDGNRVLTISSMDRTDTGAIHCNVSNDINFERVKCSLTVYYGPDKPIITQKPKRAELEERVTLGCSAESLPPATFSWVHKGKTIDGNVVNIREMEEHHLGVYTCTAHNAVMGQEASEQHKLRDSSTTIGGSTCRSMMVCIVLTLVRVMLI